MLPAVVRYLALGSTTFRADIVTVSNDTLEPPRFREHLSFALSRTASPKAHISASGVNMSVDYESSYSELCKYYGVKVDPTFQSEYADKSDDECDVETSAEPINYYNTNWYCPIYLGEVLNNRYIVENKLGWGGFSTVWMAYDKEDKKMVALKILASSPAASKEAYMHDTLRKTVRENASHLVLYCDKFEIKGGEDGQQVYRVLVLPLRGPNLRDCCKEVPTILRMLAAEQVLDILRELHSKDFILCGT